MAGQFDFFRDDSDAPAEILEQRKAEAAKDSFTSKDMENAPHNFLDEAPAVKQEVAAKEISEEPVVEPIPEELEASEASREERANIKKMLASLGEENFEIPAEAKFKHKVNGEEVEVSIQELLNDYSGQKGWDKKFTELDKERQVYKKDLDQVNKYVSEFATISKQDPVQGLLHLAKSVGIDPLQYKRQLREQLVQKYGDYLNMDENERSMYEQREELEYLRQLRETESRQRAEQQAQAELHARYSSIQQAHNIDDSRLEYLREELANTYKVEPSPENIVELHSSILRLDRVEEALNKIDPSLVNDDKNVLQLESLLRVNSQMTDEELLSLANKIWGNDVSKAMENLSKKVATTPKKPEKPHTYQPKILSGNNINFFD